jgi:hypothetical protein
MGLFYVICRMKKITVVFSLLALCFGCKDDFNLPEYTTPIEDTEKPTLMILSPEKNKTYSGLTQLPIQIDVMDNEEVDEIQFQLTPVNFSSSSFSAIKKVADKSYRLDTFYTIPSKDSIVYDVLIVASDKYKNITTESYQFTTKN